MTDPSTVLSGSGFSGAQLVHAGGKRSGSLGVEQLGQKLDAVDHAGTRAREECIGIHRHDPAEPRHLGTLQEGSRLLDRTGQVEAAGAEDGDVDLRRGDFFPTQSA